MPNYSIIPHPTENRVLAVASTTGWTLPSHTGSEAADIIGAIQAQFDIAVSVLRAQAYGIDYTLYALDNHSPDWTPPPSARWFSRQDINQLDHREHRTILKRWFDEAEGIAEIHPLRSAWARRGWYDEAAAWIRQYTDAPIEQFRVRPTGNVFRVGNWYFKAVMEGLNDHEPMLTHFLSQHFPDNIPMVEAANLEHGWFLQHDAGTPIRENKNLDQWTAAIQQYARLQKRTIEMVDELLSMNVVDRTLYALPTLYEQTISVPDLWVADAEEDAIPPAKLQTVKNHRAEVERICQQLATYNIPPALHHDDFSGANIMLKDGKINFIDWGESYITQPFCSLFIFLRYAAYIFGLKSDDPTLAGLRDAYLSEWTDYGSLPRLIEAYDLAADLAKLHRALTWRGFYERLEPANRGQYRGNAEYWLQVFLGYHE